MREMKLEMKFMKTLSFSIFLIKKIGEYVRDKGNISNLELSHFIHSQVL